MFYEEMIVYQINNNNREVKNPISVKLWTLQSNFIKLVSILKKNDLINKFFNKLCRQKQTVFHADIMQKSKERFRNNFILIQKSKA